MAVIRYLPIFLLISLTGCSPANFANAPSASYTIQLAKELQGVWTLDGRDNGERVRLTSRKDGNINFDTFGTNPSSTTDNVKIVARALRFDNRDWLLVDNRLSAVEAGIKDEDPAPYWLMRYRLKDSKVCGSGLNRELLTKAIESGKLKGTVSPYLSAEITITSSGDEFIKWWSLLPEAEKIFDSEEYCFRRVVDP